MYLTSEAEALLMIFYREYCQRRSSGVRISAASYFGDGSAIHAQLAPHLSEDDLSDLCSELCGADMILADFADDHVIDVRISRYGVGWLDHRFSRNLKTVSEFLANLATFLPWI